MRALAASCNSPMSTKARDAAAIASTTSGAITAPPNRVSAPAALIRRRTPRRHRDRSSLGKLIRGCRQPRKAPAVLLNSPRMTRYWWVNHKQTARQEIGRQYLWSPKTSNNGARNHFYDNMRQANPGDLVFSYADEFVRYVGLVAEFAFTAPKPTSSVDRRLLGQRRLAPTSLLDGTRSTGAPQSNDRHPGTTVTQEILTDPT